MGAPRNREKRRQRVNHLETEKNFEESLRYRAVPVAIMGRRKQTRANESDDQKTFANPPSAFSFPVQSARVLPLGKQVLTPCKQWHRISAAFSPRRNSPKWDPEPSPARPPSGVEGLGLTER
jgi:hypothetical protein